MRIISGQYKGIQLHTPRGDAIRPTSDRVRETIFSILGPSWRPKTVLDLFAGTGAFGLEALSRGAESVTFVDMSNKALTLIRRNLEKIGATAPMYKSRAESFLRQSGTRGDQYDLIFCDPPYQSRLAERILTLIREHQCLSVGGMVIYESRNQSSGLPIDEGFTLVREKIVGDTRITFLTLNTLE
jgi:16S rRNA (guanine966-N2)-methyltransferase